jgi:hypothetical protein
VREINVSCAGDPGHAGDKALTRETPVQRGWNPQEGEFFFITHSATLFLHTVYIYK